MGLLDMLLGRDKKKKKKAKRAMEQRNKVVRDVGVSAVKAGNLLMQRRRMMEQQLDELFDE